MLGTREECGETWHLLEREPLPFTLGRLASFGEHALGDIGRYIEQARDTAGLVAQG